MNPDRKARMLWSRRRSEQNDTGLPRAPPLGKTPPAGGGGTPVPEGEQLSAKQTDRVYSILESDTLFVAPALDRNHDFR